MMCPTEFTWSLFADGEMPEAEAHEMALHLETCKGCHSLVAALRGETRMLVQCLQDADLEERMDVPEFSASGGPVSIMRFALVIIGTALAFRICSGILFGFELPVEFEWLDPRGWALNLGVVANAVYAIVDAASAVTGVAQVAVLVALGAGILAGMARVVSRNAAAGSIIAVLIAIGLFSSPSYAVDIRKGAAASVAAGETVDDTLVAAPDELHKNVDVAGIVKGDLLVVGDVVTVSGTVEGNVIAFARRVEISGNVGGSLLGAAQTVSVTGHVTRNMIAAGGAVNLGKAADIGGNTVVAGGESVVEGKTLRDLISAGGVLDLRGDVGRNVLFRGGQASVSGTAHVKGDFSAFVQQEGNVNVATGALIDGKKNVELIRTAPGPNRYVTVRFYIWQIVRILAAFIAGLILFWLLPAIAASSNTSGIDWLKAGGLGLAILVTVPVAVVIVGITIIGLPVALASLTLWLAGLYFSKIIVAEFVGRALMKSRGVVPLLAGLLVVIVAVNLPWIGGLINWLLMLLGLGAIALTAYRTNGFRRQEAALLG